MSEIVGMIVTAILNWVAGFLGKELTSIEENMANKAKTQAAAEAQKSAVTPGKIDAASKDISSNF